MIYIWDSVYQIIWFVLPVFIAVKWRNRYGWLFAILTFYFMGFIEGDILSLFNQNRLPLIDTIWMFVGIPAAIIYATFIMLITKFLVDRKKAGITK